MCLNLVQYLYTLILEVLAVQNSNAASLKAVCARTVADTYVRNKTQALYCSLQQQQEGQTLVKSTVCVYQYRTQGC